MTLLRLRSKLATFAAVPTGPLPSQSPAYQDISLAIQRALDAVSAIDPRDPTPAYERLRTRLERAIDGRGLL